MPQIHSVASLQTLTGAPPIPTVPTDASRPSALNAAESIRICVARPRHAPLMQALVRGLSMHSRYQRFFYPVRELSPDLLELFTQAHPMRAITLLALAGDAETEVAVGMAQYAVDRYPRRGDFAVVVADAWQRAGIATRLLRSLICVARTAGIERIEGDVLSENEAMRKLLLKMEFEIAPHPDGAYLRKARKELAAPAWSYASPSASISAPRHGRYAVSEACLERSRGWTAASTANKLSTAPLLHAR